MTGLPPRRFPAPPGVALGGKVQLRGSNVGNLDGGAEKGGKKTPKPSSRTARFAWGVAKAGRCPAAPGCPVPGAEPGQRRAGGAERCGGGREGGGRAFGLLPGEEK